LSSFSIDRQPESGGAGTEIRAHIAITATRTWNDVECGCTRSKRLLCTVVWQQECEAGMRMLPHLPFICLQQACSAAVICDAGMAHAITGASSDNRTATVAPILPRACIQYQLTCTFSGKQPGDRFRRESLNGLPSRSHTSKPDCWQSTMRLRLQADIFLTPQLPMQILPCRHVFK
jgi:hypothetical protein